MNGRTRDHCCLPLSTMRCWLLVLTQHLGLQSADVLAQPLDLFVLLSDLELRFFTCCDEHPKSALECPGDLSEAQGLSVPLVSSSIQLCLCIFKRSLQSHDFGVPLADLRAE
ncbi:hypothetical protein PINS_up011696 [Pythium insidiosum]|nr:hypothetical protein PINS_up011696 [Pythium insidiosum]